MKSTLFFCLFISSLVYAQDIKSPGVLVLTPEKVMIDESLQAQAYEHNIIKTDEQVARCVAEKNKNEEREYVLKMNEVECEFSRKMNLSKTFTFYLYGWLTFKLYGIFDDAIIYPAQGPEIRNKEVYQALAEKHDINWVVNVKKVEFKQGSDGLEGIALLELWNKNTNEITLTTEIKIDDANHAGEMSCEEGTLDCLITNGIVYASFDVLKSMFSKEEYWR